MNSETQIPNISWHGNPKDSELNGSMTWTMSPPPCLWFRSFGGSWNRSWLLGINVWNWEYVIPNTWLCWLKGDPPGLRRKQLPYRKRGICNPLHLTQNIFLKVTHLNSKKKHTLNNGNQGVIFHLVRPPRDHDHHQQKSNPQRKVSTSPHLKHPRPRFFCGMLWH